MRASRRYLLLPAALLALAFSAGCQAIGGSGRVTAGGFDPAATAPTPVHAHEDALTRPAAPGEAFMAIDEPFPGPVSDDESHGAAIRWRVPKQTSQAPYFEDRAPNPIAAGSLLVPAVLAPARAPEPPAPQLHGQTLAHDADSGPTLRLLGGAPPSSLTH